MNRNQKIAIGCGSAGCLGLIVLLIVGIFGYMTYVKTGMYTNRNGNTNFNLNTNRSANSDTATEDATAEGSLTSSMSDDDKHKLFQAAGMSADSSLTVKVLDKIGYSVGSKNYEEFVKNHISWTMNNLAFIQSLDTPEKARAYVEAHIDD